MRVLVSAYLIVSGITFALLMVHADMVNTVFLVPMSSKILHFVLPVYALVDIVLAPGRRPLLGRTLWISLVFPLIWGIYTLIRGQLLGWYPYFFLNPTRAGYAIVAVCALTLTGSILCTSSIVWALHRSRLARPG